MTRGRSAHHPGVLAKGDRYVFCVECQAPRSKKNLRAHYRNVHPTKADRPTVRMFRELEVPAASMLPAVVERPAPPPELEPLGADDVVLAVVDQLAVGGMLPVHHLPAVFAWRDATATFLRSVT